MKLCCDISGSTCYLPRYRCNLWSSEAPPPQHTNDVCLGDLSRGQTPVCSANTLTASPRSFITPVLDTTGDFLLAASTAHYPRSSTLYRVAIPASRGCQTRPKPPVKELILDPLSLLLRAVAVWTVVVIIDKAGTDVGLVFAGKTTWLLTKLSKVVQYHLVNTMPDVCRFPRVHCQRVPTGCTVGRVGPARRVVTNIEELVALDLAAHACRAHLLCWY